MALYLITLSALIAVVLLVRAVFRKKVSARLIYALWLVVALILTAVGCSFVGLRDETMFAEETTTAEETDTPQTEEVTTADDGQETPVADTGFYQTVENIYGTDGSVYYTDLTGDGVAEICTVNVQSRGAQSYIEGISVTDGQSGETILVGDPSFYTDNNIPLVTVDGAICRVVDYTVRDGVLMCYMRISAVVDNSTKIWSLSYTYSYAAGELAITGASLRDDITDEVTDFGKLTPMASLPTDIVQLLDLDVAMMRILYMDYGELSLKYSEHGTGSPVYSVQNLLGVFVHFYSWDMYTPLTDSMVPDEVILDDGYTDVIGGLEIGKNIEDCTSLIVWESASYELINTVVSVQTTIGQYTLTARIVTDHPEQWNLPDESTATDAEWEAWQRAFLQNPTGEIAQLRIKKAVRTQNGGANFIADSVTYIDLNGAYMPISYIQDGKQLLTGDAIYSFLIEDILKDAPTSDSLPKEKNIASNAVWDMFPVEVEHMTYTPENQPKVEEWSEYFAEKLESQNTPVIIADVWSFELDGQKVAVVFASNVTSSERAYAVSNPPAADSTVLYRMSAVFVQGREPQDLYSENFTFLSEARTDVSYSPSEGDFYEQSFSAWQYDASGEIVECPIFNNMSGGYTLRDYAYTPEYTVCDIDGDGAAEVICYIHKASSIMSWCKVYRTKNGEFEEVFHLVPN